MTRSGALNNEMQRRAKDARSRISLFRIAAIAQIGWTRHDGGVARYLKKQVAVDAVQWLKNGDHPAVIADPADRQAGYIDTPEGRLKVEPGDWIITGIAGENYPCKPDIFDQLYTRADQPPSMDKGD
jgi:hypothetical protein